MAKYRVTNWPPPYSPAATATCRRGSVGRIDSAQRREEEEVIRGLRQSGADMSTKYKETVQGGLPVNVVEC